MDDQELVALIERVAKAAVAESKKPYVDPKKEANDRLFRDHMRNQQEENRKVIARHQEKCPHLAGSSPLSTMQDPGGRTSIAWHQTRPATLHVGICSNCQKHFLPTDSDYALWRSKKSFHRDTFVEFVKEGKDIHADITVPAEWTESVQKTNDLSYDPNLWSDKKLNEQIEAYRDVHRLMKVSA